MNTWDLSEEYVRAFNYFVDAEDIDGQVVDDTLEALEGPIEDKLLAWVKWRNDQASKAEAMKAAEKAMSERRKALENQVERSKQSIITIMQKVGLNKVEDAEISCKLGKPSKKVQVNNENMIPSEFFIVKKTESLDKKFLMAALKEEPVPGAELVDGDVRFTVK